MRTPPRNTGFQHPYSSEITPKAVYEDRRQMLKRMAGGAAGCRHRRMGGAPSHGPAGHARPGKLAALASTKSAVAGAVTMEKLTDYKDASTYNNFTSSAPTRPTPRATRTPSRPRPGRWRWRAHQKPGKYGIEDLLKLSAQEERIYRLRCVEGWSMVIPWVGYSLAELIKRVEPMGSAKVRGVCDAGRQGHHALCGLARARLALCGGPAHG